MSMEVTLKSAIAGFDECRNVYRYYAQLPNAVKLDERVSWAALKAKGNLLVYLPEDHQKDPDLALFALVHETDRAHSSVLHPSLHTKEFTQKLVAYIEEHESVPPICIQEWMNPLMERGVQYTQGEGKNPVSTGAKKLGIMPLGEGDNASVYVVQGDAAKVVKKGDWFAKLVHEYSLGKRLRHPNIVVMHELYQKLDVTGKVQKEKLLMDRVFGKTLRSVVKELSNEQKLHLIEQAAGVCLYLFEERVCWNDLHGSNLMVSNSGNHLTVIDLAQWYRCNTATKGDLGDLKLNGAFLLTGYLWIMGCILNNREIEFPEHKVLEKAFAQKNRNEAREYMNQVLQEAIAKVSSKLSSACAVEAL